MARRSLQLHSDCVEVAKAALKNSRYKTQIRLAIEAEIQAQSTVSNFFCGKPVERANFIKLCQLINLDPSKVGKEPTPTLKADFPPILSATKFVRSEEELWCQELFKPHAVVKIQAPSQFGKTSLMWKMLDRAEQQGHLALYLDLNAIELSSFKDPQTFFRRFICEIISEIETQYHPDCLILLEQYDRPIISLTPSAAFLKYLEHLQQKIAKPLTIGINKLDRLLDFPETGDEFLFQLRNMHEKSKKPGAWQNFRLLLAYSTPRIEEFVTVVANRSPFNVGSLIKLAEFSSSEIAALAATRGLILDLVQIDTLMQSIGGIPSLVYLTLDRLQDRGVDLTAITPIYQEHLETLELWLQQRDLYSMMQQIAIDPATAILPRRQQNLLHRQGLISSIDNRIQARCELYRQFFAQ
jgi:AAA-like domain